MQALRELFPDDENYLEEYQFSRLHKIILGFSSQNLEKCLATCSDDIDSSDFLGNTALIWAARRNDIKAVRILLDSGASPNIQNSVGCSALHDAVSHSTLQCVRLLLSAGADSHLIDIDGYNPLHFVRDTTSEMVQCLVTAGVDVNGRNSWGMTPLASAALRGLPNVAEALLDNAADIDPQDNDGDHAIHEALRHNCEHVLRVLLDRGADYTTWTSNGDSVLHQAASSGSLKTIEILTTARLKHIDPDAKNRQSYTVLELAQQREDESDDFVRRVRRLLTDIRSRNARLAMENSDKDSRPQNERTPARARDQRNHHSQAPFERLYSLLLQLSKSRPRGWSPSASRPRALHLLRLRTPLSRRTVALILCFAALILYIYWIFRMRWMRLIIEVVWTVAGPGDFEL